MDSPSLQRPPGPLGPLHGICSQCKKFKPLGSRYVRTTDSFKPYVHCSTCREWQSDHYQGKREEVLAATHTTQFKKKRNKRLKSPKNKLKGIALRNHPDSIQRRKEHYEEHRDEILARHKIAKQRPAAVAKRREWNANNLEKIYAQPSRKPAQKRRHDKIRNDPGLKLQERLRGSLAARLSGKLRDEPTSLPKFTEFKTVQDILDHFTNRMQSKPGMTLANYGQFWSIGHTIPVAWYDSSNIEDVRRCNSKMNLDCDYTKYPTPTGELTNQQKSVALPPDAKLSTMIDCFPVEWGGKLPSIEYRKAKERSMRGNGKRPVRK